MILKNDSPVWVHGKELLTVSSGKRKSIPRQRALKKRERKRSRHRRELIRILDDD